MRGWGVSYCPWLGSSWSENGVCPLDEPLWAGGRCCSGHYVVVPALEDCNADLRGGVVAVCQRGREVVVWGADAGCAEDGVAVWCGGLFPLFRAGSGPLGGRSPLGLVVGVWSLVVSRWC